MNKQTLQTISRHLKGLVAAIDKEIATGVKADRILSELPLMPSSDDMWEHRSIDRVILPEKHKDVSICEFTNDKLQEAYDNEMSLERRHFSITSEPIPIFRKKVREKRLFEIQKECERRGYKLK